MRFLHAKPCFFTLLVAIAAIVVFASGCSTNTHYSPAANIIIDPAQFSTDGVSVHQSILEHEEYEIVSKVFSRRKGGTGGRRSDDTLQQDLVVLARDIGAEVIMGYRTMRGQEKGTPYTWASGLAARRIAKNYRSASQSERLPFIVAVVRPTPMPFVDWQIEEKARLETIVAKKLARQGPAISVGSPMHVSQDEYGEEAYEAYCNGLDKYGLSVLEEVQYQLELRGYYVLVVDPQGDRVDINSLRNMNEQSADALFGMLPEYILLVDVMGLKHSSIGFSASASNRVNALLFSRSDREIAWEGEAIGTYSTGFPAVGLVPAIIMVAAEKEQERVRNAFYDGVERLFRSLPSISVKKIPIAKN